MTSKPDRNVSPQEETAAYKRLGAALLAVGEDPEKVTALHQAVAGKSRERYRAFVEDLRVNGYPLEPEDCPIITFTAVVRVPAGLPVLVWATGPQEGQPYTEPKTLTIAEGVEIPTPSWWTTVLEQLGIIRRMQLFVRDWQSVHAAVCGGAPDLSPQAAD